MDPTNAFQPLKWGFGARLIVGKEADGKGHCGRSKGGGLCLSVYTYFVVASPRVTTVDQVPFESDDVENLL